MIRALALILGLQLLGESLVAAFALPLPGPVIGMIALFALLWLTGGPADGLDRVGKGLLDNLGLLFVPAGVGVTLHLHLLGEAWAALVLAVVVATVISIAVVARAFLWLAGPAPAAPSRAEEG